MQSSSARGLRKRRTERVCLVVGSIGVPTYGEMARELHAAADDEIGYGVVTLVADSAQRARHARTLLRQGIADGAVIWTERFTVGHRVHLHPRAWFGPASLT